MAKKISVIIVTYNRINYLESAIKSVLSQSFADFELIVVNNGSNDGTYELCQRYSLEDDRIKLINIEVNKGAARGRNMGIDAALGEYITIVDDDDYCENQMLEHLIGLANKYNSDISICGSYNDFGDKVEPYFVFEELLVLDKVRGLEELLKRIKYNVAPPTKLFRKKLFENIRFKEGTLIDDIHVIYKVFANADKVVVTGIPMYYFRKHQDNMTSFIQSNNITSELLKEYLSMYKERTVYLSEKVPEIELRAVYSEWSYMISMCDKIKKYDCKSCNLEYIYMRNKLIQQYKEIIKCSFIRLDEMKKLKEIIKENTD